MLNPNPNATTNCTNLKPNLRPLSVPHSEIRRSHVCLCYHTVSNRLAVALKNQITMSGFLARSLRAVSRAPLNACSRRLVHGGAPKASRSAGGALLAAAGLTAGSIAAYAHYRQGIYFERVFLWQLFNLKCLKYGMDIEIV